MNSRASRRVKELLLSAAVLAGFAALALYAAPAAQATPQQDGQYVACVTNDGLYSNRGPSAHAATGREIATDITSGLRTALQERNYVYETTPANIGLTDANWLVNCATEVYLGYGAPVGWNGVIGS
jgi:hypothetical protein